jgi:hypothetical protein
MPVNPEVERYSAGVRPSWMFPAQECLNGAHDRQLLPVRKENRFEVDGGRAAACTS